MEKTKCKKCNKDIFFKETKNGKLMPFDYHKTMFYISDSEIGLETVLSGHVSHFATCPYASTFSKGNKDGR